MLQQLGNAYIETSCTTYSGKILFGYSPLVADSNRGFSERISRDTPISVTGFVHRKRQSSPYNRPRNTRGGAEV
jgi:hypothetical protein